jgi:hypothetical protein
LLLLVDILVYLGGQIELLLIAADKESCEDGNVFLQFDNVIMRTSELKFQCAFSSVVCLMIEELLLVKFLLGSF